MTSGDISGVLMGIDPDSLYVGVIPDPDEIGSINRARTEDARGNALGTFTSATDPTDSDVAILAALAAGQVADTLGDDLSQEFVERARGAAAFYAAALVEQGAHEPRLQLIDQWTKIADARVAAIAKLMASGAPDGQDGPQDAGLPVYSFPVVCIPPVF